MNNAIFRSAFAALTVAAFTSPAVAEVVTDPAPSTVERSHVLSSERSTIESPGKDHPSESQRVGNREVIDFGKGWDPTGIPDSDVTIDHDVGPVESQDD